MKPKYHEAMHVFTLDEFIYQLSDLFNVDPELIRDELNTDLELTDDVNKENGLSFLFRNIGSAPIPEYDRLNILRFLKSSGVEGSLPIASLLDYLCEINELSKGDYLITT